MKEKDYVNIEESLENELTLQIEGHPDMTEFASFVSSSSGLIKALTTAVIPPRSRKHKKIFWFPIRVNINGATSVSYEARTENHKNFFRIEEAFFQVAEALRRGEDIPYTTKVATSAQRLRNIISSEGNVKSLVFLNRAKETIVKSNYQRGDKSSLMTSYDEVQGQIETISSRKGLRFILYDTHFDKAITCYLDKSEDKIDLTKYFDKQVRVMGLVTRDLDNDQPIKIRGIQKITIVEPSRYNWREASGIVQFPADITPESFIRSLRDV